MNNNEFLEAFKNLPEPKKMVEKLKSRYEYVTLAAEECGIPSSTLTQIHIYSRFPLYRAYKNLTLVYLGLHSEENKEFLTAFKNLPEPDEMIKAMRRTYSNRVEAVAYFCEVSSSSISRLENGSRLPQYASYRKIVIAYLKTLDKK